MVGSGTLTGLFHELVRSAMTTQQIADSDHLEFYLVHLLEQFTRPGKADLLDPPLALDYLEAGQLPSSRRYEKLKRVADTALFVTGMFVDSLERSPVGPAYYAALGRNAYAWLSTDHANGALGDMFGELAGRFRDGMRVLMEVSEQDLFHREQDTLRVYRRWLATGGSREAALLVRRGIIPSAPTTRHRH